MKKLLLIALLIVGCDNSTEPDSDTYSVSDLEGVWMGTVTYDDDQTLIFNGNDEFKGWSENEAMNDLKNEIAINFNIEEGF